MKSQLKKIAPGPYSLVSDHWHRHRERQFNRKLARIAAKIEAKCGLSVQTGPFRGMRYVESACGSALLPKLVGSYEAELHGVLTELLQRNFTTIVDAGCAEGYYAIGVALKTPQACVHAFDLDERARTLCARMANLNNVAERVRIAGACTPGSLAAIDLRGALLICDVEGYEIDLLLPDRIPQLEACFAIVELHDCNFPGITKTIVERFKSTHTISIVPSRPRLPQTYPQLSFLKQDELRLALDELRPQQHWAVLYPRS